MTVKLVIGWLFVATVACSLLAVLVAAWQQARDQDRIRALAEDDPADRRDSFVATVTPIAARTLTPAPQAAARTGTR